MKNIILLISSGSTFMVDALSNGLKDAGIMVIKCAPKISELEKYKDNPPVILFYLGSFIDDISDVLVYLKDMCVEKDKILCTIGDPLEFEALTKVIPAEIVKEHYNRPLNVKNVAEKMQIIMSMNNELAKRKRILLVDDDPTFLTLIKSWLEDKYRVVIVNSGVQAITYLATNTPDLILLDYEMPVTPGPKVLEMIRSESSTSTIPVIFLTGKGDKESVKKVLSLKPEGYILKGIDKEKLKKQIDEFFEKRKG
ncbi:response regulator [Butyrivibrio sp. YAB3001]|uniref:response regulator n=1 Tax=Butyrivibrio sp. YAB3001 TaxID=1520812 RepID=UPI0008F62261|nr:response regulator [Butyrivibrio sp. YAB3001]SFC36642.1 Response regulator receiver domain-containing protein [Butyrivibrio sp. YAB3001]